MSVAARILLLIGIFVAGCGRTEMPESDAPPVATKSPAETAPAPPSPSAPPTAAPIDDAARTALLARVALIGASATGGFGAVIDDGAGGSMLTTLSHVFAAAVQRTPPTIVTNGGNLMFFNAPMEIGPGLIDGALNADPTLVVAVDFLFWYGYGSIGADGRRMTDDLDRLDLLEEGLAQLERFEGPLVVGDFPDVSPAIGLMLSAAQVPSPDTLEVLNARVYDWAADRPQVIVLPFADLVERMRTNEAFMVGDQSWPAGSERVLVQPDRLHPTPRGLVAIVQMVAHELMLRYPMLRATDFGLEPDVVIGRVRDMMRRDESTD